jgi:peptidoglycan-N-acetylglucosamine deacetylase
VDVPAPLVSRQEVADDVLALTFDDGPSAWTDAILDALEAAGARATFFVIGGAIDGPARQATLRRIAAAGCELGNHTFTHPDVRGLTEAALRDELERTTAEIEGVAGVRPRYWRPPYLRSDDRARRVAHELGLREVGCSIATTDYESPGVATAKLVLARARRGDIVDLHDGRPVTDGPADSSPTREDTVHAVQMIVAELARRGLRPVTVSELLAA